MSDANTDRPALSAPAEEETMREGYNRVEAIRAAAEGQDRLARGTSDPIAKSEHETQAAGHWDRYEREVTKLNATPTLVPAEDQFAAEDACLACNPPAPAPVDWNVVDLSELRRAFDQHDRRGGLGYEVHSDIRLLVEKIDQAGTLVTRQSANAALEAVRSEVAGLRSCLLTVRDYVADAISNADDPNVSVGLSMRQMMADDMARIDAALAPTTPQSNGE